MASAKTYDYIEEGLKRVVEQHFAGMKNVQPEYLKEAKKAQVSYIGAVCQSALILLPLNRYYAFLRNIYEKHGYDPGGVRDGHTAEQESLFELVAE